MTCGQFWNFQRARGSTAVTDHGIICYFGVDQLVYLFVPNLVLGKVAHCIGCRIVIVFSCDDKADFDAGAMQKYQADAKEPCGELSVTTSSVQQVSSVLSATLSGLFNVTFAAFDRHCISYLVQFVLHYSFCLETFIFAYVQKLYVHFFCFF